MPKERTEKQPGLRFQSRDWEEEGCELDPWLAPFLSTT